MGRNDICYFNFLFNVWTGSGRGRSLGNVGFDLSDLTIKYGAVTTSRSEVIEFTVTNDFFGEEWGNSPTLSPPLIVLASENQNSASSKLKIHLPSIHVPSLIQIPWNWPGSPTRRTGAPKAEQKWMFAPNLFVGGA